MTTVTLSDGGIATYQLGDPIPAEECYPKREAYVFNEFAGPIFELGGYSDMTLIDPWSGRRLWVADALGTPDMPIPLFDAIRYVLQVAEAVGFLVEPGEMHGTE